MLETSISLSKNTCAAFRKQVLENVFKDMLNFEYLLQSTLT